MQQSLSILFLAAVLFASCDRPDCTNANQVFSTNKPNSNQYVLELAKQLKSVDQSKRTYWIKAYEKIEAKEYLNIYIQGDGLCAQTRLLVEDWSNLEFLHKAEGKGYIGAEIQNLRLELRIEEETSCLVYVSHDAILD
ncbi:MAG: hypothetical protein ACI9UR_000103 [Bacteroidia bacterium]|jgi:hypothetical protein